MDPIQIVIDTNVLVSAARSSKGASYALIQRLRDSRLQVNVSTSLMLEYEEKLKTELKRQGRTDVKSVDSFLNYVGTISNRWSVQMSLPVECIATGDQFVFDLAIAAEAQIIVTFNCKHFRGARPYGINAMWPGDFLKMVEKKI